MRQPLRLIIPEAHEERAEQTRTVLLVIENPRLLRAVSRVMRASHVNVVTSADVSSAPSWLERLQFDLVVFDHDLLRHAHVDPGQWQPFNRPDAPPLILLTDQRSPAELAPLIEANFPRNMVAKVGELDGADLLITTRKLIERDIFGIEKYLHWGSVVHAHDIQGSDSKAALLFEVEKFLDELGCSKRVQSELVTVADELLMNALYDAPVGQDGKHLHAAVPRNRVVQLPPGKSVRLEYGADGRFVAIGCRDPFGSLDPQTVRRSLARALRGGPDQIRQAAGGAGIGLYLILQSTAHFVINLDPGVCTEAIAVADITRSPRERHLQPKSFNLFLRR